MNLYEKIQTLCRAEGFEISNLGQKIPNLKITRGSISGWKNGAKPRADKIKIIADYFGVPVSYFNEGNAQTIHDNHGVIGDTHAPVTINNGAPLGDIEKELLNICAQLDMKRKNALLMKAYELLENL